MKQSITNINEIPIYKAIQELDGELDKYYENFPAFRQRTTAVSMANHCEEMITLILLAIREPIRRITYLRRVEAHYVALDYLIRKCFRLHLLSQEHYEKLMPLEANVSKQLTGWIITTASKTDE